MVRCSIIVFALLAGQIRAQNVINGDLEGVVSVPTALPPGWQAVPLGDPACFATQSYGATPDLTGPNGPLASVGLMGNPFSGNSFVSGLWYGEFHEGIEQHVSGFTVGCAYTVGFRQAVVKQNDALDRSGGWSVYLDDLLIGTTAPSSSSEPPISLNMPWDLRSVTFTPTAPSHELKFLPADDDPDQVFDGLRMGIDSIHVRLATPVVFQPMLGNDTVLCPGNVLLLTPNVADPLHWQDGSTASSFLVNSSGTFWVEATQGCQLFGDSITVTIVDLPPANLGPDRTHCDEKPLILFSNSVGDHLWSDGSNGDHLVAEASGQYWVQVVEGPCLTSDTVQVVIEDCGIVLDLPNVFTPNGSGLNELWKPIKRAGIRRMQTTIYGRWGDLMIASSSLEFGWNGITDGEQAAEGTYFYVIEYMDERGTPGTRTGTFQLLR